jgi:hypothetical protein
MFGASLNRYAGNQRETFPPLELLKQIIETVCPFVSQDDIRSAINKRNPRKRGDCSTSITVIEYYIEL